MALEVYFAGVSAAWPTHGEETACYVVDGRVLVDAGWNAAISLQAAGIKPTDIDHAFFTHCHQDHTLGLPGLLFANGRRRQSRPDAPPLVLHGPRDLPAVRDGACALLQAERYPDVVPEHELRQVFPGEAVELGRLRVEVGRAFHPLDARCYRFTDTVSKASVVFTGDTAYHEGMVAFSRNCDALIHEAAAPAADRVEQLQRYLHSRPQDAARVAKEAGASTLALVHYDPADSQTIQARAKEVFPNTRLARKGQRMQVLGPGQVVWV
jgi:ribonuclease Z